MLFNRGASVLNAFHLFRPPHLIEDEKIVDYSKTAFRNAISQASFYITNAKGKILFYRIMITVSLARQNRDGIIDALTLERRVIVYNKIIDIL